MKLQKVHWQIIFGLLALAWCATIGLYLYGVFDYPGGWLILMVLAGWAWFKMREIGD